MPLSWQKDRVPVKTLFHYYQPDSHGSAVLVGSLLKPTVAHRLREAR